MGASLERWGSWGWQSSFTGFWGVGKIPMGRFELDCTDQISATRQAFRFLAHRSSEGTVHARFIVSTAVAKDIVHTYLPGQPPSRSVATARKTGKWDNITCLNRGGGIRRLHTARIVYFSTLCWAADFRHCIIIRHRCCHFNSRNRRKQ